MMNEANPAAFRRAVKQTPVGRIKKIYLEIQKTLKDD
jgi:hypothetical protein